MGLGTPGNIGQVEESQPVATDAGPLLLDRDRVDRLIALLAADGHTVIGPVERDGAIVLAPIASTAELPAGRHVEQDAGRYRVVRDDRPALFGCGPGPASWKRFLHVPERSLWRARRADAGFAFDHDAETPPRFAFLGVRACELAAIAILDRVLLQGAWVDPAYAARRALAFVIAVQCGHASRTCFCASMGTGPRATHGFDIALTELDDNGRHAFVAAAGTRRGAALLERLGAALAGPDAVAAAERVTERARAAMTRVVDTEGLPQLLARNLEHRRFDDAARRCMGCGNCTQVCPTCFCTTVEDRLDLTGREAERCRRWDSCFSLDFSHIHGGSVRPSVRGRWRHWLVHKFGSWQEQFGTLGCVGCGRCITWCPAGIDVTEELAMLRATGRKEQDRGDA